MKKLTYMFMIGLAAYAMQGCGNASKTTAANADSTSKTTDTASTAAKDTAGTAATTGGATADADDTKFATAAANGGMAEVALGKLAQEKGSNGEVKAFGAMMVKDHGKANDELMAIAKTKNITLPATVDAEHQQKMEELAKLSGKAFDKAYVDAMVDGHKKTLDLMENGAKNCKDADLKAFAAKTAPVVKMHLDAITKIQTSLK